MDETFTLLTDAAAPRPKPWKRHVLPFILAAVTISAVALTRTSRATAEVAGLAAKLLDDDDDALYDCTMGKPNVATAYKNGSWGTIEGDWYVVAGKYKHDSDAAGDCCRMKFQMPNSKTYNQHMMYQNDDGDDDEGTVYYYWNYSGNVEYKDTNGLWYNHGKSDDNGAISYDNFWSNVFLVGTYNGARWFGWYECGKGVAVTEYGIPFILSEDRKAHENGNFTAMVEEKLDEVLTWSDDDKYEFTVYRQSDCDYYWHDTSSMKGDPSR